jgi:trans-aconitate methyltransferase
MEKLIYMPGDENVVDVEEQLGLSDDGRFMMLSVSAPNAVSGRGITVVRKITTLKALMERHDFESLVLDPVEVYEQVHRFLKLLSNVDPEEEQRLCKELVRRNPKIAYLYHMELSTHPIRFKELINKLHEEYGIELETPFADVGCGPGHMTWWFLKEGRIPLGRIALVDSNAGYLRYAKKLMDKQEEKDPYSHGFHFMRTKAEKMHKLSEKKKIKFRTIYSSLMIQWVKDPVAVLKSIYKSMEDGGKLILIGEVPANNTATTPISLVKSGYDLQKLSIGYENAIEMDVILEACREADFTPVGYAEQMMGMVGSEEELDAIRVRVSGLAENAMKSEQDIIDVLSLVNHHYAIAFVLQK